MSALHCFAVYNDAVIYYKTTENSKPHLESELKS